MTDVTEFSIAKSIIKEIIQLCRTISRTTRKTRTARIRVRTRISKTTSRITSRTIKTRTKRIKLDFGRDAKFEGCLVDSEHDAAKIRIPKNLELDMKCNSFILLKEV